MAVQCACEHAECWWHGDTALSAPESYNIQSVKSFPLMIAQYRKGCNLLFSVCSINQSFHTGQSITISRDASEFMLTHSSHHSRGEKETEGVKERIASKLQWLVLVVNFLLPSAWRNSIDCLLFEARVICITYSPSRCQSPQPFPQSLVYSVRLGPCWIGSTALPCQLPCPWLGFNCLGLMLGQAHTP